MFGSRFGVELVRVFFNQRGRKNRARHRNNCHAQNGSSHNDTRHDDNNETVAYNSILTLTIQEQKIPEIFSLKDL